MNLRNGAFLRRMKGWQIVMLAAFAALCLLQALQLVDASVAHAAGPSGKESLQLAGAGTGLGGAFDEKLKTLLQGTVKALNALLVVMTAIAGMMIAFGLEDGKKFIWQVMLGAGLALNFGAFMMDAGLWSMADTAGTAATASSFSPNLVTAEGQGVKDVSILGEFVKHFKDNVIGPGATNITPYCLRLLVILTVIQATWDLTTKFMSGDKMQYLINMTLKTGFLMFLMMNWVDFMSALMEGFQLLGTKAAGSDFAAGADLVSAAADAISQSCFDVVKAIAVGKTENMAELTVRNIKMFAIPGLSPSLILLAVITVVVLAFAFFMVAIEIAMAYIEFYVMMLLTIPCMAFGTFGKLSFLAEKAIGCMFNCALKVCVVGFLALFSKDYIKGLAEKLAATDEVSMNLAVMLQMVLASLLIYFLVKKIPQLVSGLLNGAPQLSGSDMTGTLKSTGNAAVNTAGTLAGGVGAVRAASQAARAAGRGGLRGTLTQLGRHAVMSSRPVQAYRRGVSGFRDVKDNTGSYHLNQIRQGIRKQDDNKPQPNNAQNNSTPSTSNKTNKKKSEEGTE